MAKCSTVVIRPLAPGETRRFLEIIRTAVRITAARDYPPTIVEAWAPWPITQDAIDQALAGAGHEVRLAAEQDGRIIGIGVVIPPRCELRACYVLPEAGRTGVGRAIVAQLEKVAREAGASRLELDSSVTAEPFYRRLGYDVVERGQHVLSSGVAMASVKMRKDL